MLDSFEEAVNISEEMGILQEPRLSVLMNDEFDQPCSATKRDRYVLSHFECD